jgi:hypothetical protein
MNESIPHANLDYPNKMGRFYLIALQDVLRQSGFVALMNWVNLPQFADELPPDTWDREFDFSLIARSDQGLTDLYGPRGGRRLALRTGRRFFERGLRELGAFSSAGDLALRALPQQTKLKLGLNAVARIFTQTSDQESTLEDYPGHFVFQVNPCPVCWGRTAREPICFFTVGLLQEAMFWLSSGQSFQVRELFCIAAGNEKCAFQIDRQPLG